MQPLKGFAFGQSGVAVFYREQTLLQLNYGCAFLFRVAQQAVKDVAVGGFFQVHTHRLVGAQRHEVRAVAKT